jgi:hypothetical protein
MKHKPVYYIEDEHSKEDVALVWTAVNSHVVENRPHRSIHQHVSDYGDEWGEVFHDVLDDPYNTDAGEQSNTNGTDCPFCHTENVRIKTHIPDDCPEL